MSTRSDPNKTAQGFGDPQAPQRSDQSAASGAWAKPESIHAPVVDVELSYVRGQSPCLEPNKRWLELWTQNSVYVLDSRLCCLRVYATDTHMDHEEHPFIGSRLVGGQVQNEHNIELSYPLPRPGSCAVFEGRRSAKRRFSRTSMVKRVVMHLQIVAVDHSSHLPSWGDLVEY